ncbi:uncharacterized protein LOC113850893 [Abrus precatorius]|uniref:Uncharacterized protein LOC113850893 n=1 Tax=Abrus precatorius TaxID=3816 RepID=A0A8B8K0B3_ABRPR|nr:uncharacterized protein LOC113850893 [Abrus precatorius]
MSRDHPMVKKEGDGGNRNYHNRNPSGRVASRPKAHGNVFAMSGKEVSYSDTMIGGTSHLFISSSCVERLRLSTIALPFDLSVHTLSNDPVMTAKACWECPISIDGRNFVVNLFCLPLKGLKLRIQSANYKDFSLKEEVRGFVMSLLIEGKREKLDDLPVLREFPDVFPDDIPGLPPE